MGVEMAIAGAGCLLLASGHRPRAMLRLPVPVVLGVVAAMCWAAV